MNMVWLLSLISLTFCITATGQESVLFLALHDSTLQASSHNGLPIAVKVDHEYLKNVSESVLMAEYWVRVSVLAYYPAINISTIVVGHSILCNNDQEHRLGLILPSIKNIHHSLTRWGLQNDIKVSASFSSNCLDSIRADLAETYVKPLLHILQEIGSPYVVNPPPHLVDLSNEHLKSLLKIHYKSVKNLGISPFYKNMIITTPGNEKPTSRKLSLIDSSKTTGPLPPLIGTFSPPPNSLPFPPSAAPTSNPTTPPFLPHWAPIITPTTPPFLPHLPPCNPSGSVGAPLPGVHVHHGLWCVAKPSVPPETLQVALDYACGEGDADCEAIRPGGNCYYPDTVVAHTSYAFNSYWQKTKKNGGTCGFGGTAMLINSDPSYAHCGFILT